MRTERLALIVVVIVVPLVSWTWVIAMGIDMYGSMNGAAAWMMATHWTPARMVLLWGMWAAMMAGMMVPAASPLLLLYRSAARRQAAGSSSSTSAAGLYALGAGYLLVWGGFSVGATVMQRLLSTHLLLTPMMEPATPFLGAAVLAIAGVYQLTPLKQVCLTACRSPLSFLMQRWRPGPAAALRLGVSHGTYCLGCCWALMLILFAGGVMNLAVILALTLWVLVEKLAPFGEWSARAAGVLLLLASGWSFYRAATTAVTLVQLNG